jgi:hypothetical protein
MYSATDNNKLSGVGRAMQQPEKDKENFDVSSEGPLSGVKAVFHQAKFFDRIEISIVQIQKISD